MSKTPTDIEGITIRPAVDTDVPLILNFIHQLAAYEKRSDQVVATEDALRERLFGTRPYAEVIFVESGGVPAGFALFFHSFSTFLGRPGLYLEDIYVRQDQRGQSCGKALMVYLARLAMERGCGRFEWSVLDWNEPAIGFYKKLGAKPKDEWDLYQLAGTDLEALAK